MSLDYKKIERFDSNTKNNYKQLQNYKQTIIEESDWGQDWTWSKQQRSISEDCLFAHIHPGRIYVFSSVYFLYLSCVNLCISEFVTMWFLDLCVFSHTSTQVVHLWICVLVDLCICKFTYFLLCVFFVIVFFVHFVSHTST